MPRAVGGPAPELGLWRVAHLPGCLSTLHNDIRVDVLLCCESDVAVLTQIIGVAYSMLLCNVLKRQAATRMDPTSMEGVGESL